MPLRIRNSILGKTLAVLVLLLLPVLLSLFYIYRQNIVYLEKAAFREAGNLTSLLKSRSLQLIALEEARAKDFSSDGFIRERLDSILSGNDKASLELGTYLSKNKLPLDPFLGSINIVSIDGAILASTNPGLTGQSVGRRPSPGGVSSYEAADPAGDGTVLAVSAPLETGKITSGFIVNIIPVRKINAYFWQELKNGGLESAINLLPLPASIYILGGDGKVLYSSELDYEDHDRSFPPLGACGSSDGRYSGYHRDRKGIESAGVALCVSPVSWTVAAEIAKKDIFSPLRVIENGLLIGFSSIVLMLILFWAFFRMVLKPINALSRAMKTVAGGVYEINIPVNTSDEIGRLSGLFNRMVSEIRNRDSSLKSSEEKFRNLVETSGDFVWEVDRHGVYTYVSPRIRDILGYEPEEVLGRTPFDLMPPAEAQRVGSIFAGIVASRAPIVLLENTNFHKGGRAVTLETSGSPIIGEDGELCGYRGIDRDITERKKAQEALRVSEEKYRRIFDNSKDVIFISKRDGTLLEANRAALELFKYPSMKELLKHKVLDFYFDPADRARFVTEIEGRGFVRNFEMNAKDSIGGSLTVQVSAVLFHEGKEVHYLGILRDVTEQRELEAQLLQSQKMEAIGQLTSGIAHDFNNILTALIGYAKLLDARMEEPVLKVYSSEIVGLTSDAAEFIRRLLSFSRKNDSERLPVGLEVIISDVDKLLSRVIGEDITLEVAPCASDAVVSVNVVQIEQALVNLANNARDAMPQGGTLGIKTSLAEIKERFATVHGYVEPGRYAVITVSDTGTGMDGDVLNKIFDPFFTTKPPGKGTGLGLSTVYWIIKQHNGYMSVKSSPGRGTAFRIYLPVIEATSFNAPMPPGEAPSGGSGEVILVTEDDENVRGFLDTLLKQYGYRAVFAKDCSEALRLLNVMGRMVSLVIGDVMLPDRPISEIHGDMLKENPRLKFIFMSGYPLEVINERLEGIGGVFIQKPFKADEILAKIKEALGSDGAERPLNG